MPFSRNGTQPDRAAGGAPAPQAYWAQPASVLAQLLGSGSRGLDEAEAARRLAARGPNALQPQRERGIVLRAAARLLDPLVLILIAAALLALTTHDWLDAATILAIVLFTALLGAIQEHRASGAVERLRRRIAARARVLRDGAVRDVAATAIVPGDVLLLSAGSLVAADAVVLEAKDFFVSQSLLTGETFPVEKEPGAAAAGATLAERRNCVYMGTSVRSGTANALVVATGMDTAFGGIARRLALRPPETEFERGLKHFGALLVRVMLAVVLTVFGVNLLLERPAMETLLFAMALAVGISPELLPAVLTVTLAHGTQRMARKGVIVRRLNAIENLGSMDVLCTDKTGTLTRGVVQLDAAVDPAGQPSAEVLRLALLNARLQTGLPNPLDEAIAARGAAELHDVRKLDEIPYDFVRKRLSVVVAEPGAPARMITKGALDNVLEVCVAVAGAGAPTPLVAAGLARIRERFAAWSRQGYRVLGVAYREVPPQPAYGRNDETAMVFAGFLLFFDPPEPQAIRTLRTLRRLGVQVKIVTGDNRLVAQHVARAVGLRGRDMLTGGELATMKDEALWHRAPKAALFAEVEPHHKERIIRALQKTGHVVGYLGDGINDAPALQAADVGISVDQAVDVARQAADFVLLRHDLGVLAAGIDEGRHTFANTLKYIFTTTSANFGNMISMALASLVLPFLPLLAKQILLNNFLSDLPALGIAGDNVDREWRRMPHRWDLAEVRRFMFTFGLVSSAFDVITFGALLWIAGSVPELFRTGWFVESLLTELLIIFVVRTYKPFYRSRPGRFLLVTATATALFTIALPFLPLGALFGLVPLPASVLALIVGISVAYALASEAVKMRFFRRRPRP